MCYGSWGHGLSCDPQLSAVVVTSISWLGLNSSGLFLGSDVKSSFDCRHVALNTRKGSSRLHLADRDLNKMADILQKIFEIHFLIANIWIWNKISLTCPIDNTSALVQIMAWCPDGTKPSYEPVWKKMPGAIWHHQDTMSHAHIFYKYHMPNILRGYVPQISRAIG